MTPLEIRFRAAAVAARKAYAESDARSDAEIDAEIDARSASASEAVSASPAHQVVNKTRKRKEMKSDDAVRE